MIEVFSAPAVHAALPWGALADALHAAFVRGAQVPLRHVHPLSPSDVMLLMPAWDERLIVTKLVTAIPGAPSTVEATVLAVDRATGRPLAVLDGEAVTLRRTAATSALAARHLARERSLVLKNEELVTCVEVDALHRSDCPASERFHESQALANRVDHALVLRSKRRVPHELEIPVLRMM